MQRFLFAICPGVYRRHGSGKPSVEEVPKFAGRPKQKGLINEEAFAVINEWFDYDNNDNQYGGYGE